MRNFVTTIALGIFLMLGGTAFAQTDHIIDRVEGLGGSPFDFIHRAEAFRAGGVRVVLDGKCISSCTLYTSLLPDNLICARPGAVLVFHRYNYVKDVQIDGTGHLLSWKVAAPVTGTIFTAIWDVYPLSIRRWILTVSPQGLPAWDKKPITVRATRLVPPC